MKLCGIAPKGRFFVAVGKRSLACGTNVIAGLTRKAQGRSAQKALHNISY
jgi:hypothetical protein